MQYINHVITFNNFLITLKTINLIIKITENNIILIVFTIKIIIYDNRKFLSIFNILTKDHFVLVYLTYLVQFSLL